MGRGSITRRDFATFLAAFGGGVFLSFKNPVEARAVDDCYSFEDDLGRSAVVPETIRSVLALGVNAQTLLVQLCPDLLVSLVKESEEDDAADYEAAGVSTVVSQLGTGVINSSDIGSVNPGVLETLQPDVMIDAGLPREQLAEDLDRLQDEINVPCLFFDLSFGHLSAAYRRLGLLFGRESRAEVLAEYVESIWVQARSSLREDLVVPLKVLYAPRIDGAGVSSSISVQLAALEHLGVEVIEDVYDYESKTLNFNKIDENPPEIIVFDDLTSGEQLALRQGDVAELWQDVIDRYCIRTITAPARMHSWVRSMVFVQSIGLLWLQQALRGPSDDFVSGEIVQEYYEIFYRYCPLSVDEEHSK